MKDWTDEMAKRLAAMIAEEPRSHYLYDEGNWTIFVDVRTWMFGVEFSHGVLIQIGPIGIMYHKGVME